MSEYRNNVEKITKQAKALGVEFLASTVPTQR